MKHYKQELLLLSAILLVGFLVVGFTSWRDGRSYQTQEHYKKEERTMTRSTSTLITSTYFQELQEADLNIWQWSIEEADFLEAMKQAMLRQEEADKKKEEAN